MAGGDFDVVPLGFATESFTFTMFEGISCTFFAEQVFMLPVVIVRRAILARNIEIQLDVDELILKASASKPLMDLR